MSILSGCLQAFLGDQFKIMMATILGDPGADSGGEGKSKRAEKHGTKEK